MAAVPAFLCHELIPDQAAIGLLHRYGMVLFVIQIYMRVCLLMAIYHL